MEHSHCHRPKTSSRSQKNEKLTLMVVVITLVTMVVEIIAGLFSGSMALLSDGVHMGTHSMALFITLFAYIFARKQMKNPDYSFGTGKVGILGGYTNAVLLMLAGAAMIFESVERLFNPVNIHFNEAIIVAVAGLLVNIVSAVILGYGHNGHHHGHTHGAGHGHHHEDHNLKSAYLHVITDALTSVLAITALLMAKYFNTGWADPAVAILGGAVVMRWAVLLLKQTAGILVDKGDYSNEIGNLKSSLESATTHIRDIHIWQISENERSLIISLDSSEPFTPDHYRGIIAQNGHFDHITVEVNPDMAPMEN